MKTDSLQLQPIEGTALFYPCCGQDLETPIRLFASVAAAFYFVDIRKPSRLRGPEADVTSDPPKSIRGPR